MKKIMTCLGILLYGIGKCASSPAAPANTWSGVQSIRVPKASLIEIKLPYETLGNAHPSLKDLRLFDPAEKETAYFLKQLPPPPPQILTVPDPELTMDEHETQVLVETDPRYPTQWLSLQTPAREFLKAATVEGSQDKATWKLLLQRYPLFRQPDGTENLHLDLTPGRWRYLRIHLNNRKTPPIPITSATIAQKVEEPAVNDTIELAVLRRIEAPHETRLELQLPAANLFLTHLQIESPEPLFRRQSCVIAPIQEGGEKREPVLATGTLYRMEVEGKAAVAHLSVPVDVQWKEKTLILVIKNGDSGALQVKSVRAAIRPVILCFRASQAGTYRLYSGNPFASRPDYDLAGLQGELATVHGMPLEVSPLENNPQYQKPAAVPMLEELGAPIDVSAWRQRLPVEIRQSGIQYLTLGLRVLAQASPELDDLRLVRDGHQIPYLVDSSAYTAFLEPQVSPVAENSEHKVSRWKLELPYRRIPAVSLTCSLPSSIFARQVRVYEELTPQHGRLQQLELGRTLWRQTPLDPLREGIIRISNPLSDTLYLEIENGDNPPLELGRFRLQYTTRHLLFKASPGSALWLYYDNPKGTVPRYDIALVADELVNATKVEAILKEDVSTPEGARDSSKGLASSGTFLFWGAMVMVVLILLAVIRKLLPPPASGESKEQTSSNPTDESSPPKTKDH
jgi:hypothetical protein